MNIASILCIFTTIITVSSQNVLKKYYNNRPNSSSIYLFSAITVLSAWALFFVRSMITKTLTFDSVIIPYAIVFAVSYCLASIFNLIAIQCGSLSLTSLISSYSLIIPTAYGLIFDGDISNAKTSFYIGLAFLIISLFLISNTSGKNKISLKWIICVLIAFIGNGACSTVQPEQSEIFSGKYDDTFMVIALAIVFIILFSLAIVKDRSVMLPTIKSNSHIMIACGLSNGIANLLIMVATGLSISKSLLFPLISAGGIVITWLVSVFLYKEKLSKKQNMGLVFGIIAIVFLNI